MTGQIQSSKIDGLVEIGAPKNTGAVSKADSFALIGTPKSTIEATKIDSFSVLIPLVVQHENIWTGQWIGPPGVP